MAEEVKTDKKEKARYYATGKRKTSIARVWVISGNGKVTVNDKKLEDMYIAFSSKAKVIRPLILTNTQGRYDVMATVKGGGPQSQSEALMYGIAKVLDGISEEYHRILKTEGLLTRDSRIVERKKYGRKKARKMTQYRKR